MHKENYAQNSRRDLHLDMHSSGRVGSLVDKISVIVAQTSLAHAS